MKPEIVRTVAELRECVAGWRRGGGTVGMVPTMGALHAGHLELVRAAIAANDHAIVTLFVNPAQFAAHEDLGAYPRTEAADREKLATLGPDILFAPSAAEMYPPGFATSVSLVGPATGLETDFRPHFFTGVATVVAKLLLAGLPDRAYFGEKDYQQLLVVRRMVSDLRIPTEIVGCATIREPDGLALSSRNAYLSPDERAIAPGLQRVMAAAAAGIRAGGPVSDTLAEGRAELAELGFGVDYLALRNSETLAEVVDPSREPMRLLAAAKLGNTRLIDNIAV